jgi:branched-chain amino acid transport system ATP-binding protein
MEGVMRSDPADLLRIDNAKIVYGRAVEAVRDMSLRVPEGRIVALLGTNGAGKSTLLKAISGVLPYEGGEVVSGSIKLRDQSLVGLRSDAIVRLGAVLVPEGRRLFGRLTVRENLTMGGFTRSQGDVSATFDKVMSLFPPLQNKLARVSGLLSGGEQQMVAVGRALMADPRLLMLDEPSLGLAPMIFEEIFRALRRLRDEQGMTILLIEQNAQLALSLADHAYIMENGSLVLEGRAEELADNPLIRSLYLGLNEDGARRSLKDQAPTRARVRWPA